VADTNQVNNFEGVNERLMSLRKASNFLGVVRAVYEDAKVALQAFDLYGVDPVITQVAEAFLSPEAIAELHDMRNELVALVEHWEEEHWDALQQ
jgi:hypothetical protein